MAQLFENAKSSSSFAHKPVLGNCSERRQIASAAASGIEKTYRQKTSVRSRAPSEASMRCRRTHHVRTSPASVLLSSRRRRQALTIPTTRPPPIMQLDYYTLPRQQSARGGSSASPRRTRKKNNRRGRAPQALQPLCADWRRRQGRNRGSICLIASSLRSARRSV